MTESNAQSKLKTVVGLGLLAVGIAVFAVRFTHEGAYAVPRGGNLFGGLGALVLGGLLVWPAAPHGLGLVALVTSPVVLFFGLYATMSELEEVVSLYATDSAGRPAELRWGTHSNAPTRSPPATPPPKSRIGILTGLFRSADK
jgi:hypothetical protein